MAENIIREGYYKSATVMDGKQTKMKNTNKIQKFRFVTQNVTVWVTEDGRVEMKEYKARRKKRKKLRNTRMD